jgi:hypothetical protein
MMFPKILIGFFRSGYDTMLFQTKFFHFGIIIRHSLQINLEKIQIIVSLPVELVELSIFLLQGFSLPSNLFYLHQLIRQVLVFMLDLIQLSFNYD